MRRGRNQDWRGAPLALAVLAAPVAVNAQEADEPAQDSLRVSVGATYTDGRYGQTTRTEIATVPVSVKYTRSRFSVQVTTSYVTLRGPGTLLDGGTGGGASGSSSSGSGSSGSGVAVLRGDWTRQDPAISRFLKAHGRAGVPLYLWYPAGGEPRELPQVLSADLLVGLTAKT